MIACYDLSCNPPTYDVVAFLALLELERLRRGAELIDLHITPGPIGGFRQDGLWPRSIEERVALREKVLEPICWMLPRVNTVTVHRDRTPGFSGEFGAGDRKISLPAMIEAMEGHCRPLRPPGPVVNKIDGLITFTLREADHHPSRNSVVKEWVAAARSLEVRGYIVNIVRDTIKADELLHGWPTDFLAAKDMVWRANLYASATLNVGISNGPMWMALFMDVPTLMLRPCEAGPSGYTRNFFKRCGIADQLPNSPAHQRLVWKDDTCENIVQAVEEMVG